MWIFQLLTGLPYHISYYNIQLLCVLLSVLYYLLSLLYCCHCYIAVTVTLQSPYLKVTDGVSPTYLADQSPSPCYTPTLAIPASPRRKKNLSPSRTNLTVTRPSPGASYKPQLVARPTAVPVASLPVECEPLAAACGRYPPAGHLPLQVAPSPRSEQYLQTGSLCPQPLHPNGGHPSGDRLPPLREQCPPSAQRPHTEDLPRPGRPASLPRVAAASPDLAQHPVSQHHEG